MELDYDDVLEILALIEHSNVEYLEIDVGTVRLVASRSGVPFQPAGLPAVGGGPGAGPAQSAPAEPEAGPEPATGVQPPPAAPDRSSQGLVTARAPVVGVFYRQSEPGAVPYVEVGSAVAEGDTLGLLEVMKVFTGLSAPAGGVVAEILVEDGAFVEFDQPVMRIRPG